MRTPSLRLRLYLLVGLLVLSVAAAIAGLALKSLDKEISSDFDAQLVAEGKVLARLASGGLGPEQSKPFDVGRVRLPSDDADEDTVQDYVDSRGFRIWAGQKIVSQSETVTGLRQTMLKSGFSTVRQEEIPKWRAFSLSVPGRDITVETFESLNARRDLEMDVALGLLLPFAIILPALAALVVAGIRFGLRSIDNVVQAVESRALDDFSELNIFAIPRELRPLLTALNSLLKRLARALQRERELIDNAAHELKTPLARINLQGQLIARAASLDDARGHIRELTTLAKSAADTIDDLLFLARLKGDTIERTELNLADLAKRSLALQNPNSQMRDVATTLEDRGAAVVKTNVNLAMMLIGTVLDNALKFARSSVRLRVDGRVVEVVDDGPGIPQGERGLVFERFYRSPAATPNGSGLGLSIAGEVARVLGVRIELLDPEGSGGLRVCLTFPAETA